MRCTISHHQLTLGEGHLDIFFESETEKLETYEASFDKIQDLLGGKQILCSKKEPHRSIYLDYEGEISNNRGSLKILWKGSYSNETGIFPDSMKVKLFTKKKLKLEF